MTKTTACKPAARRGAPWARWVAACLLVVLVTGCSTRLVYPRLDTLVGLYLRNLVSLDDRQDAQLARVLEHNLEWHRREELGRYDAFLREMADEVQRGLTRDALEAASRRAETYWRRIFEQAAPGYAEIASTLTEPQVRELLRNLERRDEKTWQEFAGRTAEERLRDRERSVRKGIERIVGDLDDRQRRLIADYARDARPFMFEWRENRGRWREALADALAARSGDRRAFDAQMNVLIAQPDQLWTDEYRKALQRSREDFLDLLLRLDATLTVAQRTTARERLLDLADDVRSLALRRA